MKTRSNDDISIVSRKTEAKAGQPDGIAPPVRASGEKTRISLASKISSAYNRMFTIWLSVGIAILILMLVAFDFISVINSRRPYLDDIRNKSTAEEAISAVNGVTDAGIALLDNEDRTLASTIPADEIKHGFPVAFTVLNGKIFMSLVSRLELADGAMVAFIYYHDVSFLILKLAVISAVGAIILIVSLSVVLLRGNEITRKTFGVIDELISKANSISSQNLNLRLNVSDSTDELLEFALTFNNMMDRIEKAYAKQNQFVSDASHELRTPIAVVQGYARMLERWGKEDKAILQESISAINKEAANMQDLVEKLLFIARNDRDTLVLVNEKFDLSELVEELARETKMLETGHGIESFIKPGVMMFGDRSRIKQALRIFTDNALKYTPGEGTVTIGLDVEGDQAVAVIKDTGIGIPEKDLANIFDRFYRVDEARERNKGGHGLGLSIARIIILRHGGRIKVASKMGEGTRFSVYLPLAHETETGRDTTQSQ